MADIKKELNQIKTAIYGKDVRGSIHDGIDKINKESEDSKQKANEAHDVMESIINDGFDNAALEANFEQKLDDEIGRLQPEWTQFKNDTEQNFNSVTSQLNETDQRLEKNKMDKNTTDISISQINKNKGLLDETYFTDKTKQQWAGNTPIHSVPADYSLTLKKNTYSKIISSNLFDKNAAEKGRIDGLSGDFFEDDTYYTSEYVAVESGKMVKFSNNVARYAFFDVNETYITGENLSSSITELSIPPEVFYLRVSFYYANLDEFMMSVGSLPEKYEPFQMAIPGKYLTDLSGESLLDESVNEKKTTFFEIGKNLANPENLIIGKYVSSTDGSLKLNDDYSVFHMIPVEEGKEYSYNFDGQIAFYDASRTFVDGIFGGGTIATKVLMVPSGAAYASFSTKSPNAFQLEKGSNVTNYEPYALKIKKSLLPNANSTPDREVIINLPSILYATVGEELIIYNKNFLKDKGYNINYVASFGKQMSDRFIYTPNVSGTQSLTIEVYKLSKLVSSKTVNILTSNERVTPLKVMVIGDSTVRTNGFGYVTQRLKDKLNSNIELIGTMGTDPNNWEGRGGWRAATYRTNESYEDMENPFYNPSTSDFDFSYYMTKQGFANVDVVIINLGINDVFSPTADSVLNARIEEVKIDFNFIINNIKSYNPNIKVALNITIPPNDSQDAFGTSYGAGQTQWRYKYNNFEWVSVLIDEFESKCDVIPIHLAVDTKNDISDGVHPKNEGYNKIGDCIYSYLNSLN